MTDRRGIVEEIEKTLREIGNKEEYEKGSRAERTREEFLGSVNVGLGRNDAG